MGAGTPSGRTKQHEEPGVESTKAALTGDLEVDLEPDDVWTLGQLIEADVASFPPGIAQEIVTGYRILQGAGYQPAGDTEVQLQGVGDVTGLPLPEGALDEDEGSIFSRQIVVTELTETEPAEEEAETEPAAPTRQEAAGAGGQPAAGAAPVAGEQAERLADAVEQLAEGLERSATDLTQDTQAATDTQVVPATDTRLARVTVDWALIGLGLTVSTMFVIAAGFLADPGFAILGLALLGFAAFQSYPYLADTDRGDRP